MGHDVGCLGPVADAVAVNGAAAATCHASVPALPDSTGRRAVRLAAAGAVTVGAQWLAFVIGLRLANDNGDEGSALTFLLLWTVFLLPWAVLALSHRDQCLPAVVGLYENNNRENSPTLPQRVCALW